MGNKNKSTCGCIALILVLIIIGVWFFSHFRISILPVNEIESIANQTYYDCPGVGLQEETEEIGHITFAQRCFDKFKLKIEGTS